MPGNDRLRGGPGRNRRIGGQGRDRLHGGIGFDRLRGGSGRDLLIVRDRKRDHVHAATGATSSGRTGTTACFAAGACGPRHLPEALPRRRERELGEEIEQTYRQLVADSQAQPPAARKGVAAANGARLSRPSTGEAAHRHLESGHPAGAIIPVGGDRLAVGRRPLPRLLGLGRLAVLPRPDGRNPPHPPLGDFALTTPYPWDGWCPHPHVLDPRFDCKLVSSSDGRHTWSIEFAPSLPAPPAASRCHDPGRKELLHDPARCPLETGVAACARHRRRGRARAARPAAATDECLNLANCTSLPASSWLVVSAGSAASPALAGTVLFCPDPQLAIGSDYLLSGGGSQFKLLVNRRSRSGGA